MIQIDSVNLWICIIMATIIAFVYYLRHKKKQKQKDCVLKETADVDFSSITHDWEKAKNLYDILKKKCHPDKFGDDLNEEATRIFQLLGKHKYNYNELIKIKNEAIKKLGIEVES